MNALLPWCLLLTGLAGCHAAPNPAPAPVDPFLGHWRADTERLVLHTAAGQISKDTTVAHRQEFDFAAITYTKLDYDRNGAPLAVPTREDGTYARTGDQIGFSVAPAGPGNYDPNLTHRYVRALTPDRFTLETIHGFPFSPQPRVGDSFVDFHR